MTPDDLTTILHALGIDPLALLAYRTGHAVILERTRAQRGAPMVTLGPPLPPPSEDEVAELEFFCHFREAQTTLACSFSFRQRPEGLETCCSECEWSSVPPAHTPH